MEDDLELLSLLSPLLEYWDYRHVPKYSAYCAVLGIKLSRQEFSQPHLILSCWHRL